MRARSLITLGATAAVVAAATAAVALDGAGAASTTHAYYSYAGGSQIRAADATISSDLSVQSAVFSADADASDSKHTAKLAVSGLLSAAAVTTSATTKAISGGRQTSSTARSAGVALLGNAITIDAVTTTSLSRQVREVLSSSAATTFAGLHIAGVKLPLTIPKNYNVTIPGVASVTLNYSQTAAGKDGTVSIGSGLVVTLLNPYAGNPLGSVIYLSPTYSAIGSGPTPPSTGHNIAGQSYGTSVSAKVGSVAAITSDPTASNVITGRAGTLSTSRVAGVHVPGVLVAGAVTSSGKGTNNTALADAVTTNAVADVKLLGNLITVKAITASAHARQATGRATTYSGSSALVGLTVAGRSIPLGAKPNTTLSLGSLGKVVLNEQTRSAGGTITVRALHITLGTAAYGLDAGAQITVGYASASAN